MQFWNREEELSFFLCGGEGKMFDVLWEYDLKETETKQKVWSGRDFFSKISFLSWCAANQMASEPLCDQHWGQSQMLLLNGAGKPEIIPSPWMSFLKRLSCIPTCDFWLDVTFRFTCMSLDFSKEQKTILFLKVHTFGYVCTVPYIRTTLIGEIICKEGQPFPCQGTVQYGGFLNAN